MLQTATSNPCRVVRNGYVTAATLLQASSTPSNGKRFAKLKETQHCRKQTKNWCTQGVSLQGRLYRSCATAAHTWTQQHGENGLFRPWATTQGNKLERDSANCAVAGCCHDLGDGPDKPESHEFRTLKTDATQPQQCQLQEKACIQAMMLHAALKAFSWARASPETKGKGRARVHRHKTTANTCTGSQHALQHDSIASGCCGTS